MKHFSSSLVLFAFFATANSQSSLTLGSLATSRGLHFGAAVTFPGSPAAYDSVLVHAFNTVVCENAMKWQPTENTRNVFTFAAADAIVSFTLAHGMSMRGHNFVWHSQVPAWVSSITNRDTLLKVMKNHIDSLAGHYKGKIYEWDVVNEAVADGSTGLRTSFWFQRIGADFIDSAFVYAHRADPNALLVYNDYGAEGMTGGSATKSTGVYNLVSGLKSRGIPINGVGLQCHLSTWDTASIGANMTRIEALGLNVSITEFDDPQTDSTKQKADYTAMVSLCLRHPRCKTFMTWGLNDAQSWLGAGKTPLLFTGTTTITAKPAYYAVVAAITGATGIQQFGIERAGVMRQVPAMKNGAVLFNSRSSIFDLQGRQMPILPVSLPK